MRTQDAIWKLYESFYVHNLDYVMCVHLQAGARASVNKQWKKVILLVLHNLTV